MSSVKLWEVPLMWLQDKQQWSRGNLFASVEHKLGFFIDMILIDMRIIDGSDEPAENHHHNLQLLSDSQLQLHLTVVQLQLFSLTLNTYSFDFTYNQQQISVKKS